MLRIFCIWLKNSINSCSKGCSWILSKGQWRSGILLLWTQLKCPNTSRLTSSSYWRFFREWSYFFLSLHLLNPSICSLAHWSWCSFGQHELNTASPESLLQPFGGGWWRATFTWGISFAVCVVVSQPYVYSGVVLPRLLFSCSGFVTLELQLP